MQCTDLFDINPTHDNLRIYSNDIGFDHPTYKIIIITLAHDITCK